MMSCLFVICFLPLSLSLTANLFPSRTVYDDFIDVLRTSDDCILLYQYKIVGLHQRNHTSHIGAIQKDLFEKYIEMRRSGMTDVIIEPLLNLYCSANMHIPIALAFWKPPSDLTGNYTWNLTDNSPENEDYHHAVHKQKVFLDDFETQKKINKFTEKQVEPDTSADLKQLCRVAAFIITFSLALSIHNLLRLYYEDEDDEDDELFEHIQRLGFRGELVQLVILISSLICVLLILYDESQ